MQVCDSSRFQTALCGQWARWRRWRQPKRDAGKPLQEESKPWRACHFSHSTLTQQ